MKQLFHLNNERLLHGIKTAFAVLIGFIITRFTRLPGDQWLVITILVVMCAQINVGSMLDKSTMRFLATLIGSIAATLTLFLFGTNPIAVGFVICLFALMFSYLATGPSRYREAGTLGAATTAIILIGQNPTYHTGIQRFLEISAGIFIAAFVSQFVFPIHARTHLKRDQIITLKSLRDYYIDIFLTKNKNADDAEHHKIDEDIIKSLIIQRKIAIDATREPRAKKSFIVSQFNNLLFCEREILRSITFMHHAYEMSCESRKIFSSEHVLHDFHEKVCEALQSIATHVETNRKNFLDITIPSVTPLRDVILEDKQNFTEDDEKYTSAFLFCAEILVSRLNDMVSLVK